MERSHDIKSKNANDSTSRSSGNLPLVFVHEDFREKLIACKLFNILELYEKLLTGTPIQTISEPIKIIDFEMLEAELINQGILPHIGSKLSQSISREVNNLTWTTKSMQRDERSLSLFIDIPNYLIKRAAQNLELIEINGYNVDYLSKQELSYLEHFARYLNGAYETVNNSYEKGLNLILHTIKSNGCRKKSEDNSETIVITLPVDKKNLAKLFSLKK